MTVGESVNKGISWWEHLSTGMKAIMLTLTFLSMTGGMLIAAGRIMANIYNSEQAWRVNVMSRFDKIDGDIDGLRAENASLREALVFVQDALDDATRPTKVFELNPEFSRAREGYCVEQQVCVIDLRVRRTIEGVGCKIVPNSERYYFVSSRDGNRIQVTMSSGTPSTQIGREWFDYHRAFEVPPEMAAPVGFMYEVDYTQCRGESDTTVIRQESEIVPITVLDATEVERRRRAGQVPDLEPGP